MRKSIYDLKWILLTASVVNWSEFLATDPEVPGSNPLRYHIFWEVVDLERGPLSLVRIIEELKPN
jgi:hypothetical protein